METVLVNGNADSSIAREVEEELARGGEESDDDIMANGDYDYDDQQRLTTATMMTTRAAGDSTTTAATANATTATTIINLSAVDRIKKKAKRPSSLAMNPETGGVHVVVHTNGAVNTRQLKNSRKPRNGFGRGLPKKGGAGGKGTWGRPGSEIFAEEDEMNDDRDPNYDSDSQDNIQLKSIDPELTEEELQKAVEPIILEYFEHGDTSEVALSLEELNIGTKRYQITVILVMLAMDHKPSHREMTSVLISDLYLEIITQKTIARGFDYLLKNLPDIVLDTPEAPTILGNFIARAVADDCLPPKYVHAYKGTVECTYARAALDRADVLLNMKHGLVRLDNVWGVGGGTRPVKYLIKKMVLLLKEYLSSGDATEATRCLQELEVPHFHHELVYEAVVIVIEDMGERAADLISKLLKSLYASIIITLDQMKNGFIRVYEAMPDICIDVPQAYTVLEKFVGKCQQSGFLSDEIVRKMPSRGRKRFVSEGDGGRIKEENCAY